MVPFLTCSLPLPSIDIWVDIGIKRENIERKCSFFLETSLFCYVDKSNNWVKRCIYRDINWRSWGCVRGSFSSRASRREGIGRCLFSFVYIGGISRVRTRAHPAFFTFCFHNLHTVDRNIPVSLFNIKELGYWNLGDLLTALRLFDKSVREFRRLLLFLCFWLVNRYRSEKLSG